MNKGAWPRKEEGGGGISCLVKAGCLKNPSNVLELICILQRQIAPGRR